MFTTAQIAAIIGLLLAFGVSQTTVDHVRMILEPSNQPASTTVPVMTTPQTPTNTPAQSATSTVPTQNSGTESGTLPVAPSVPTVSVQNFSVSGNISDGSWAQVLGKLTVSSTDTSVDTVKVFVQTSSSVNLSIGGWGQYVRPNATTTITAVGGGLTGTSPIKLGDAPSAGDYTVTVVGIGYEDSTGYKELLGLSLPVTFTVK